MYKNFFKRVIDIILSLTGLILVLPILIVVAIWLHFANKGAGVFFLQDRPGKNAKLFTVVKFKTMSDERDSDGNLLPDEKRLTRAGRFIRATSIDELPQLFNVLKGDMALIGPRPLLPVYLQLYTPNQARRHEVRPGITGWAQIHGRNLLKLSKKFEYDVWYVDNCSFALDCKIAWMTVLKVFKRDSIGMGAGNMQEVDDLGFMERINRMK